MERDSDSVLRRNRVGGPGGAARPARGAGSGVGRRAGMGRFWQSVAVLGWLGMGATHGGQINFGSTADSVNLTSTGAAMTGQMVFELGVFDAGFTPTAENVALWASKWHRARLAFYNAKNRYVAGSFPVTSNAGPFAVGARGYLWGHDGSCATGESLLLSSPGWMWPSTNPLEFPVSWTVDTATQAVIGQFKQAGFHMKTAAVTAPLPVLTYAEWRDRAFSTAQLADSGVSGPLADPDGDGFSNLVEFAFGGVPLLVDSLGRRQVAGLADVAGRAHLTLTVLKRCDRLCTYGAEAGSLLSAGSWSRDAAAVQIVEETAERVVFAERLVSPTVRQAALRAVVGVP